MKKNKKQFKDSKIYGFLKNHGKDIIGTSLDVVGSVTGIGIIEKVGEKIMENDKMGAEDKYTALELIREDLEAYKLEIQDREGARKLYISDSLIQKILALVFTVAYFFISYALLNHFFGSSEKLEDYELTFLGTLFGAMSAKVNTIIDFFFGGSVKKGS